jgi:hypothetical protein
MRRLSPFVACALYAFTTDALAEAKARGDVTLKGDQPITKRGKAPLGHVLMRHLDMAVAIDAQSRGLAAQFSAVTSRFATTRSITPGPPYVGGAQRNAPAGNLATITRPRSKPACRCGCPASGTRWRRRLAPAP